MTDDPNRLAHDLKRLMANEHNSTPPAPEGEDVERPDDAIRHLTDFQEQADMHGERVTVSRQALDETLAYIATLSQRPAPQAGSGLVDELERLVEARKEPAALFAAEHPRAFEVGMAAANRVDRQLAEFVEENSDAILAALRQPAEPAIDALIHGSMSKDFERVGAIEPTEPVGDVVGSTGSDWFNGDVDCDGNELVSIRADELQKLRDERVKFMWQVRDTCARAEKAEAALSTAEPLIRAQAFEEAAKVAEQASITRGFEAAHSSEREFIGARDEARDIAAAIRNLTTEAKDA